MANPSDMPARDLTSRLRAAAQQVDDPAPPSAPTWAAAPPAAPPPAAPPSWSTGSTGAPTNPPVGYYVPPTSPPPGSKHTVQIVVGIAVAIVAFIVTWLVLSSVLSDNAEQKFTDVPPSLTADMAPSSIFAPISGYTYAAVPQSHLDAAKTGFASRADIDAVESVNGRVVRKDNRTVAEVITFEFDSAASIDPRAAIDGVAAELASSEKVTIAGSAGIYGKASDGSQVVVVYKNNVGIAVVGTDRATMQDVATKLVAHV